MANLNSVDQLLMRALLGQQFKPKHLNTATASIGAVAQTTGTGLNDATSGGTNTALVDHTYRVKITTAAGTDQIAFSTDGGAFGSSTNITGSAQTIANGVTITFAATTGHTLNDIFTIVAPAGVGITTATALGNIAVNQVGTSAVLSIYDGSGTNGTLLYAGVTAAWTAGQLINLGYALQNALGLYIVLSFSGAPDLIVGYN